MRQNLPLHCTVEIRETRRFGPLRGPFLLFCGKRSFVKWLVTDGEFKVSDRRRFLRLVTDGDFRLVTDGDFWLVTDGDFFKPQ